MDAARRALVAAAVWLPVAARTVPAGSAAPPAAVLADVLDRPSPPNRRPGRTPSLRVARAGQRLVAVGERGLVALSDDHGHTWRSAPTPVSSTLTALQFVDARTGYAVGHSGVVLRSDDGGARWTRVFDGRRLSALLDGAARRQAEADGPDKPWFGLAFKDAQHGVVVGAFGLAIRTADGGATWQAAGDALPNARGLHLYAVANSADGSIWIAGEQGLLLRDAAAVALPVRGSLFTLLPVGDGDGDGGVLIGGLRGALLHVAADGAVRRLAAPGTQGIVQLQRLGDRIAAVDAAGRVHLADRRSLHFVPWPTLPDRRWAGVAAAADGCPVGASLEGPARLASRA